MISTARAIVKGPPIKKTRPKKEGFFAEIDKFYLDLIFLIEMI